MEKPNILFIIADDHTHRAVGAYGNTVVKTPALDHLAERGTAFLENRIMGGMNGAVCVPTRACVLTGVNVFQAIDYKNSKSAIHPELSILPEVFRRAGYHTFATGKWHNDRQSFARGFTDARKVMFGGMSKHEEVPVQDFDPSGQYPDSRKVIEGTFSSELFGNAAIDFIRGYDRENPFFLYLAFTAPHDPRTPPKEYADMYDPKQIPLPENYMSDHPFDNGELYSIRDEKLESWPRRPEAILRHIADYYGMISHMDAQIGRVVQALKDKGLLENTVIVYTADHGISIGQHGLMGKQNVYDHSIRVPLIVCGPGLPAGKKIRSLTYTYDIFPTLCELAGVPVPAQVDAESLLPLMDGSKHAVRDTVFTMYKEFQRSVTDGRWKLIRYYRSVKKNVGTDRIQLFDLQEDPWETRDLSQEPAHRERIAQLAVELKKWQIRLRDPLADLPVVPPEAGGSQ